MKVVPTGTRPQSIQTTMTTNTAGRDKAIAMLTQTHANQQGQQAHAVDQNAISPEQASAVMPKSSPQSEQLHTDVDAEAPVSQETQAAEPAKPASEDPQSSQYAILARKEKALRAQAQQQQQALKAEREAIKAERAEVERLKQEMNTNYVSKQQLKSQTLQTLKDAGVTYDEVTQQQIDESNISPSMQAHINRLEARLQKQETELENSRKNQAEQQDQSYKAALDQIRADAQDIINSDPAFEVTKATRSVKAVVDLIEMTFKETGKVMDTETAVREVEEELIARADRLLNIEKIKNRKPKAPATQQTSQTQRPSQPQQQQTMRTLTNATTSQRQLSAKERAILAFKGELKS